MTSDELPGTPDLADRSKQWAILVNGCFWHAHTCKRWKMPGSNQSFWRKKFTDNRRRDKINLRLLKRINYSVLTVWECELSDEKEITKKLYEFMKRVRSTGR